MSHVCVQRVAFQVLTVEHSMLISVQRGSSRQHWQQYCMERELDGGAVRGRTYSLHTRFSRSAAATDEITPAGSRGLRTEAGRGGQ